MSTERPLLCTGSVVRAILAGLQTEDRRPMRVQPEWGTPQWPDKWCLRTPSAMLVWRSPPPAADLHGSPFGSPGDLLYCRETFWQARNLGCLNSEGAYDPGPWRDKARYITQDGDPDLPEMVHASWIKRPSIHMPKRLARLWLRVEDVWVERVQAITADSIAAEGVGRVWWPESNLRAQWARLWESLYPGSWEQNQWVFACKFTLASTTGRPA